MNELLLFPCNGNALEALDCLTDRVHLLGFVDDDERRQAEGCVGHTVHSRAAFEQHRDARVLAVPGNPASYRERRKIIEGLGLAPRRFASLAHPAARVSPLARVGRNVLLLAGVVVSPGAVIEDHVCILANTVIHHHARIGAWSLLGSNVSVAGGVRVGEGCYIASGSSLREAIEIGSGTLVGMGSTVLRPVSANSRVAGVPARSLV